MIFDYILDDIALTIGDNMFNIGENKKNTSLFIKAISSIYVSMHSIDLVNDTIEGVNGSADALPGMAKGKNPNATALMERIVDRIVDDRSKDDMLAFLDLRTIRDRLEGTGSVTMEFLDNRDKWCRGRFITSEKDIDGNIKSVLYVVEVIDEEKRQRDRLMFLSEMDRMTGINNRGTGENKIRKELLNGAGGLFLLMDVDKFKSINDNFGHGVGDKVIIAIANCMRKSFRGDDIILRLGGDEFAAYIPHVLDEASARPIVDRFLSAVDAINIYELKERKIDVSIGAAFYMPDDTYSFDELYKHADNCTYESKKVPGSYVSFYKSQDKGDS